MVIPKSVNSIDNLFSDNKVEIEIFGKRKVLPVEGTYLLPSEEYMLIEKKIKNYGGELIRENDVFVYVNGMLYKWTPYALKLVVPKE